VRRSFTTLCLRISDVWDAINHAQVLIADCTDRNPNVFYELGVAHTLGKPVIQIAQSKDDIPFDVRHMRTIIYDSTQAGLRKFENVLESTLKGELERPRTLTDVLARHKKDRAD
jgi:nucleoside 2-deoxyribosyltransferase